MKYLLRFLGVSEGDKPAVGRYRYAATYLFWTAVRSALRIAANHCIVPSLRVNLFRWSGITIGNRTQVNMGVNFIDDFYPGRICLEDEVSVAPLVSFVVESHPNNSLLYSQYGMHKSGPIRVKVGAWLGAGAVVMPGITIGRCAVIGANAVVTKDVEDYAVMAGVPARKIADVRDLKLEEAGEENQNV